MAAKFTHGDSIASTRKITRVNNAGRKEPKAKSHSGDLHSRNTMTGMPGYIDAQQTEAMDGARGGPGVGPHREEDIGERGRGSTVKRVDGAGKGEGTQTRSYKASSTGKAGPLKSNLHDGTKRVHVGEHQRKMPGQKPPPTSHGKIPGGGQAAGLNVHHAKQAEGHRGRMERLKGHVKTSSEGGKRKSMMY